MWSIDSYTLSLSLVASNNVNTQIGRSSGSFIIRDVATYITVDPGTWNGQWSAGQAYNVSWAVPGAANTTRVTVTLQADNYWFANASNAPLATLSWNQPLTNHSVMFTVPTTLSSSQNVYVLATVNQTAPQPWGRSHAVQVVGGTSSLNWLSLQVT
jgi:hypothetical protein